MKRNLQTTPPPSSLILIGIVILSFAQGQFASAQELDFSHDVVPILKKHCVACHVGDSKNGGLSFNTREDLLAGGESGLAIELGQSSKSLLLQRIESDDPDVRMPPEGDRLSTEQVMLLKKWIDANLPWESGFAFKKPNYEPPLKPRRPNLPQPVDGRTNPIDRILDAHLASNGNARPLPITDATFLRRVHLDLIGLLPTPQELAEFLADPRTDKREQVIAELLNNDVSYAEHWLTFWNDLLRNDYGGTGFITGGRTQISRWLYKSLIDNKPYDEFARELLAPTPESAGFSNGIKWRGTVSAGQTVEIQFAQSVGQSFLGINLKCASCHDSFVDRWKLDDAYGLAAIYSSIPLDIHRCDKSVNRIASPAWLFPELGQVDGSASQPERLKQLASLMTHADNGRFTRTIVNRFWHRLMGHGIVHPVDAMQSEPWNSDLLDYLAVDFADHKYDLKHTLALICNSVAYQSVAEVVEPAAAIKPFEYRGPRAKRLTAEQFMDAIWQLTGAAPQKIDAQLVRGKVQAAESENIKLNGKWVWSYLESVGVPKANEAIVLRKSFPLDRLPVRSGAVISCDNSCTLYINGAKVHTSDNWESVEGINVESRLKLGKNEILIVAKNGGAEPNPAGTFFECRLFFEDGAIKTIATDNEWQWSATIPNKNGKFKAEPDDWKPAVVLENQAVWNRIDNDLKNALAHSSLANIPMVRASLLKSDYLQRTLGRPNRDQIVTMRPNDLSTLEAIDLNNAKTLNDYLEAGAQSIVLEHGSSLDKIVGWISKHALSREPTASEVKVAREVLGDEIDEQEIQDYLWAIVMQPEFQLVR